MEKGNVRLGRKTMPSLMMAFSSLPCSDLGGRHMPTEKEEFLTKGITACREVLEAAIGPSGCKFTAPK